MCKERAWQEQHVNNKHAASVLVTAKYNIADMQMYAADWHVYIEERRALMTAMQVT